MNKHTVFVAGKRFILLSDDKEDYVKKLAEDVSNTILRIGAENPTLDRRSAALLCALDYADDLEKEKSRNKTLSNNAQPFIAQADKQSKQIRELKELIEKKDKEIAELKKQKEEVKKESADELKALDTAESETPEEEMPEEKAEEKIETEVKTEEKPKTEKPMGRKKKKKNKGYKPMRQYSLFEDEKN
jgi:cell division protein ZapA (FtsZ GTPase activity inhibitor)